MRYGYGYILPLRLDSPIAALLNFMRNDKYKISRGKSNYMWISTVFKSICFDGDLTIQTRTSKMTLCCVN